MIFHYNFVFACAAAQSPPDFGLFQSVVHRLVRKALVAIEGVVKYVVV